jgi:two-component system chemotaxis response regulator CheY
MGKAVLVVDDSGSFRTLVAMTLRKGGYDVDEAVDGEDGVNKLNSGRYNLVVCDLNMPKLDGFGFTKYVKASANHKFTPVLMLTTETSEDKKAQGRSVGVTAWLSKPFQPSRLLYAVNSICPA